MPDADPTTISETAGRLRISVARLARRLRRQNVDSLGATLDAALASLDREGPLTLGELAAIDAVHQQAWGEMVVFREQRIERAPMAVCVGRTRTLDMAMYRDVAEVFFG